MKKIWFNNPKLAELLTENGINLLVNENMEVILSDDDANRIENLIKQIAPAAILDYGIEDYE